jgi:hypothetical protein
MSFNHLISDEKGAVLVGAIVVLMAVILIGVTLITISSNEVDMAANEKCMEEARYNSESCAISSIKLIKMVATAAAEEGELGIPEGDSRLPGITYADPQFAATKEAEFAMKVMGRLNGDTVCEDLTLNVQNTNLDAVANLIPVGTTGTLGNAGNRYISGYSYGVGLGGAGGGGTSKWFLVACRGDSCGGNGHHISYSRYKRVLGIPGGM